MKREKVDIFISGGGVAGLTAAAVFGSVGFSVICVDPTAPVTTGDAPGSDLRTTAFLQPARDLLEEAGLWDRLKTDATPLNVMRIVDISGPAGTPPVSRDFEASDIGDAPFGWNLRNWVLRREMLDRLGDLPNVSFRPGVGFERLVARDAEALVSLSDRSQISAKLVIAADGRQSPVRAAVGIDVRTSRYGQKALSFAVTHDMPHGNVSTEIHDQGGPFTLVPLPDHDGSPCSAVVWMTDGPEAQRLARLAPSDFNAAATDRSAGLYGPLSLVAGPQVWPIISQIADRMAAARVALIAEAAHVLPPIGAQGLNMSLADLACLRDLALASPDRLGSPEMLDRYHRERHTDILLRVKGVEVLNRTSQSSSAWLQGLRAHGIKALHDVEPIRRGLMRLGLGARG
ncbi:UbiH/UbiF family hydroxylase [Flavimaricola marinus]|uniref:2-octaprenylphenol hydroxylase n=1 Tax=Flavimaricola marinus TaxID=1819565 RepID=A0A238LJR4_9RHOB|nr:UbiH/UbiF family hydroxylase [Flavimaricola marinus]SMY09206.1 2-octaprenylphenol hydroxylase [Flavimaricola marinus]